MNMKLQDMKVGQKEALNAAEALVALCENEGRPMTVDETEAYGKSMATFKDYSGTIKAREEQNTIRAVWPNGMPGIGAPVGESASTTGGPQVHPKAAQFRTQFAAWMNNALHSIEGGTSRMEAVTPSGPISIGTTSGWDSIGSTVPTEVLPYLPSYFNLDSFGLAGATQYFTEHTRPLFKPVLSAGAADSVYAENAAPSTSQPLGLSGFTFGGTKYARLVLASYEALMNSELPLQGVILDELLSSLATTLTGTITTAFVAALTAAASTLAVGVGGSGASTYTSMIDLRHAVPPRFDLPENKWMVSRQTLAQIRNTKASTSGVPLFSPDGSMLFDRPYVINDFLDTAAGAGVGFVAFGSFADGVMIRKTPLMTRVFLELYSQSGQIGFRTQQWCDQHFLAELAGAAQPPSFQPIFYTNVNAEV
jgi:HK97 family phage major capsid protein